MHRKLLPLAALGIAVGAAMIVPIMAEAPKTTKAGTLTCDISADVGLIIKSKKNMPCMFTPSQPGPREVYIGSIGKLGPDFKVTAGGEMIWSVYVPSNNHFGALAGHYGSAGAEAAVGADLGANVLVGGSNRTVSLQPVSMQGRADLNIAAGVAELDLRPAR